LLYEYLCDNCELEHTVVKPHTEYNREEKCTACGEVLRRLFSGKIGLHQTRVQEKYFSHVHGRVVDGEIHERKLAKQKGMIELGNEKPEKHLKPKRKEYEI